MLLYLHQALVEVKEYAPACSSPTLLALTKQG